MTLSEPSLAGVARHSSYDIAYEVYGTTTDPVVLLVNGLGSQMLGYRVAFCRRLVAAGFCAVRYDNRDVGASSKTQGTPPAPSEIRALLSSEGRVHVPYSIADMAGDGIAVLDAIGVDRAHAFGMSMGGMIVQTMALHHPDRLLTMTSVMSSTGDPRVGRATPEAAAMLVAPRPDDLEGAIEMDVAERRLEAGAHFDEDEVRSYVRAQYERCHHPAGLAFQYAAVVADGDRTTRLGSITTPTLVIHGAMDPLITVSGGEATADAIPGARLLVIDTMGHDLAEPVWDTCIAALAELAAVAR